MARPIYYIEVDTLWENAPSYFVGPFATREDARAWYQNDDWTPADNTWLATSNCGGDLRTAWRIYPELLSQTEARRRGLRSHAMRDESENILPATIRPSADALAAAVEMLRMSEMVE